MTKLFVVTAPGMEPFTQRELTGLGIEAHPPKTDALEGEDQDDAGGLEFEAGPADLYRANLHLRTANRVVARLGDFYAAAFSELYKKAARLPWEAYLRPGQPVALRATCHRSRLYHSDGVSERVAAAISERLGALAPVKKFDENARPVPQLVLIRLVHDHCTISIDTSGELLHRRGYRLETAKAPLRETLAAGLLMASGWDAHQPLIDPFCGSGTIPIEAALLARRIAPGKRRRFAFMDWPNFDPALWQQQLDAAISAELPAAPPLLASDRDAGAVRIAQSNAERAGVLDSLEISCRAVSAIQPPPGPGWVVTNPPYGVRVSPQRGRGPDLRDLYAQFGKVMRLLCPGWRYGFLCSSDYLAGHSALRFDQSLPFRNGGIPVKFYMGRVGKR
jgi:putative N6-adenine-specific DNA methylase